MTMTRFLRNAFLCATLALGFATAASAVSWSDYRLGQYYPVAQATDPAVRAAGRAVVFFGNATGFVISPEGHVLTNYHVYESFGNGGTVYVEWTGAGYRRTLNLQLVAASRTYDVALYKANVTGIPYVAVDARPARVGEDVFIVGHPNTRAQEVSFGRILATGLDIAGRPSVEYSAQTWWGSSGSPVCDRAGNVIAIHWGWDAQRTSNGRLTGVPFNLIVRAVPAIADVVARYGAGASSSRPAAPSTVTTVPPTSGTGSSGGSVSGPAGTPPRSSASPSVTTVAAGQGVSGSLARTGDLGFFRLEVPARGTLGVSLAGPSGADFDLSVWKWDVSSGRRSDERKSDGQTSSETITIRDASPGTYLVVVQSYSGSGRFSVATRLDQQTTIAPPSAVTPIGRAADVLRGTGDWRAYTVNATAGTFHIGLDGADGADFDVYVFRGGRIDASQVVAIGDSPAADELVSFRAQAGTYTILVHSAAGAGRFAVVVAK